MTVPSKSQNNSVTGGSDSASCRATAVSAGQKAQRSISRG